MTQEKHLAPEGEARTPLPLLYDPRLFIIAHEDGIELYMAKEEKMMDEIRRDLKGHFGSDDIFGLTSLYLSRGIAGSVSGVDEEQLATELRTGTLGIPYWVSTRSEFFKELTGYGESDF